MPDEFHRLIPDERATYDETLRAEIAPYGPALVAEKFARPPATPWERAHADRSRDQEALADANERTEGERAGRKKRRVVGQSQPTGSSTSS